MIDDIRHLENQLEVAVAARQADLKYRIEGKRVVFETEIAQAHDRLKQKLLPYILEIPLSSWLTAPFVYGLIIPFILLDAMTSLYQAICFPVYGIAKIRRGDYLVFDRHNLRYLNAIEKLNCAYCSYANGVAAYVREVAARTEQYWCPIKHARRLSGHHSYYSHFVDYGDAAAYQSQLGKLREELKAK